jgi:hypothetical protein
MVYNETVFLILIQYYSFSTWKNTHFTGIHRAFFLGWWIRQRLFFTRKINLIWFDLQSNMNTTTTLGTQKLWPLLIGGSYSEVTAFSTKKNHKCRISGSGIIIFTTNWHFKVSSKLWISSLRFLKPSPRDFRIGLISKHTEGKLNALVWFQKITSNFRSNFTFGYFG